LFNPFAHRVVVTVVFTFFCLFQPTLSSYATSAIAANAKPVKVASTVVEKLVSVDLLTLLKHPKPYLQKRVVFFGTFSSFSSLGLDYPPALRESKNHVAVLLFRPDTLPVHKIPLSEVKLFVRRTESEKLPDLETNDVVRFEATLFSTALGDVWLDVNKLTITEKAPRKPKD
jgi:hypothetical protein